MMFTFVTRQFAVACLLLFMLTPNCASQSGNTQITGQIADSSGAVIPEAAITVVDMDRKVERRTQSMKPGPTVCLFCSRAGLLSLSKNRDFARSLVLESLSPSIRQRAWTSCLKWAL